MGLAFRGDASSRSPLGTINVIFTAPRRTRSCPSRVMSVSYCLDEGGECCVPRTNTIGSGED